MSQRYSQLRAFRFPSIHIFSASPNSLERTTCATYHLLLRCTANQKMATASTCDHHRGLRGDRELFTKRKFDKLPVTQKEPCIICTVLRPFWLDHENTRDRRKFLVRHPDYDSTKKPKLQSMQGANTYEFVLFEDELGEAYHVLFCCLYLRWNVGQ